MKKITKSTLLALAMVCGCAVAQEAAPGLETQESVSNDWNLKVGVSYRDFKRPRFKAGQTDSLTLAYIGNGPYQSVSEVLSSIEPGTIAFVNIGTVSSGSASGKGDYGFQESLGFLLGGSYTLSEQDSLRISLVADFQYFQNDSGRYSNYSGSYSVEQFVAVRPVGGAASLAPQGQAISGASMSNGAAKMSMEMDLYVLDLGVSVAYEFENSLALSLAAGPTLSYADIDSSCRALGSSLRGSYKQTDNDNEFEYGYYVSAGASYWFNERYGLSAELRYDKSFGDVGTRYVSQNLDAFGGNIAFLLRF